MKQVREGSRAHTRRPHQADLFLVSSTTGCSLSGDCPVKGCDHQDTGEFSWGELLSASSCLPFKGWPHGDPTPRHFQVAHWDSHTFSYLSLSQGSPQVEEQGVRLWAPGNWSERQPCWVLHTSSLHTMAGVELVTVGAPGVEQVANGRWGQRQVKPRGFNMTHP